MNASWLMVFSFFIFNIGLFLSAQTQPNVVILLADDLGYQMWVATVVLLKLRRLISWLRMGCGLLIFIPAVLSVLPRVRPF